MSSILKLYVHPAGTVLIFTQDSDEELSYSLRITDDFQNFPIALDGKAKSRIKLQLEAWLDQHFSEFRKIDFDDLGDYQLYLNTVTNVVLLRFGLLYSDEYQIILAKDVAPGMSLALDAAAFFSFWKGPECVSHLSSGSTTIVLVR